MRRSRPVYGVLVTAVKARTVGRSWQPKNVVYARRVQCRAQALARDVVPRNVRKPGDLSSIIYQHRRASDDLQIQMNAIAARFLQSRLLTCTLAQQSMRVHLPHLVKKARCSGRRGWHQESGRRCRQSDREC